MNKTTISMTKKALPAARYQYSFQFNVQILATLQLLKRNKIKFDDRSLRIM